MRLSDAGYCRGQYDPSTLRQYAADTAWACHEVMRRLNVDTIAVTGKSGMSVVFAAQMLDPFNFMVVRKETDQSHGCRFEGRNGHIVRRYAILDDFVSSGQTVRNMWEAISADSNVQCVAIIEYTKAPRLHRYRHTFARYANVPILGCSETASRAEYRERFVAQLGHEQVQPEPSGSEPSRFCLPELSARQLTEPYGAVYADTNLTQ